MRIRKVAYKLELPPKLVGVHLVFHASQLRKCVVVEKRVPAQALNVQETLEYLEYLVRILDWAEKSTRKTSTRFCKVLWSNHSERKATWGKESVLRGNTLTSSNQRQLLKSRGQDSCDGGSSVTSLNLFACKNMGFQKIAMKLCAHETIKDIFLFPSLKS
jgi:hypothetical protein